MHRRTPRIHAFIQFLARILIRGHASPSVGFSTFRECSLLQPPPEVTLAYMSLSYVFNAAVLTCIASGICRCHAAESRAQLDSEFQSQLAALAAKCDDLGLPDPAKKTRAWLVQRDPGRQYLFLPPSEADSKPVAGSDLENKWLSKFTELRRNHAQQLFEFARSEAETGSASNAYKLLYEVLRNDPAHTNARNILQVTTESSRPRSRQPRVTNDKYGWQRGKWWQIDSQHFQITTDAGQPAGLELAGQLEGFHALWRQVFFDYWSSREWLADRFAGKSSPAPSERKHQVVLFRDREEYLRQLTPAEPKIGVSLGYYLKGNQTSYFYAGDDSALSVWYHEAGHQLFQETGTPIRDVGEKWNFWVVEGIAVYLESAVKHDGYFTLGGWDADRLQFVRSRTMGGEPPLPFEELAALGREALQKHPDIRKLYTQAAGLTHFLMDGHAGRDRDEFIRRIALAYGGRDTPHTFATLPSLTAAEFNQDFRKFLTVSDEDLQWLSIPVQSRNLSLAGAKIGDESLKRLNGSERLEWLDLAYTPITDVGIDHLGTLPSLKRLTLVNTKITDAVAAKLAPPALPCLEELDLSGTAIGDDALKDLNKLTNLKTLRLAHTRITDSVLEHLLGLIDLEELDIDQTQVTPAAKDRLKTRLPKLK
jgi:hypothetical protein